MTIVIVGSGVAGLALACRLRELGLPVICVERAVAGPAALESTPLATLRLFEALGLDDVPGRVGSEVEGFGGGTFLLFERTALQASLRRHAAARDVRFVTTMPQALDGAAAASWTVDASGRAAALSRPIQRHRSRVADVYAAPSTGRAHARYQGSGCAWAYDLDDGSQRTIGVVDDRRPTTAELPTCWAERLGVTSGATRWLVRRPAHAQWAMHAIDGQRLSVGDAAFAHEPLAGQGLRFALAGALSAAATLRTLLERPAQAEIARHYLTAFVAEARERHLDHLRGAAPRGQADADAGAETARDLPRPVEDIALDPRGSSAPQGRPMQAHDLIRFAGTWVSVSALAGGYIDVQDALQLPDGRAARWAGGVDLVVLQQIAATTVTVDEATRRLQARGLPPAAARSLIAWATRQALLAHWPA